MRKLPCHGSVGQRAKLFREGGPFDGGLCCLPSRTQCRPGMRILPRRPIGKISWRRQKLRSDLTRNRPQKERQREPQSLHTPTERLAASLLTNSKSQLLRIGMPMATNASSWIGWLIPSIPDGSTSSAPSLPRESRHRASATTWRN